jgi:hypothetical protein
MQRAAGVATCGGIPVLRSVLRADFPEKPSALRNKRLDEARLAGAAVVPALRLFDPEAGILR